MLHTKHPRSHIARCVLAGALTLLIMSSIIYIPQGTLANAQKPDVSNVTGAQIDESSIKKTYYVDQTTGNDSNNGQTDQTALATITAGLTKARDSVEQGIPTKLLIAPGVYREGDWQGNAIWTITGQDWAWGKGTKGGGERAKNTLFVMEGTEPDKVIVSGSDVFAANEWKAIGNGVYERDWPYDIPMYAGNLGKYNPQEVIGHRREMLFVNNQPLKQILLEEYEYNLGAGGEGSWTYTRSRNPRNVLTPGTFGVADRDANGVNKIYLKLPQGVDLQSALIEVSVREKALQSVHKNNLVLRNLTFEHFANRNRGDEAAVQIGAIWGPNQNVLIENTVFRWNNGMGLKPDNIKKLTVRNSTFIYNGFSGVNPSQVQNVLWEDNEASFNNWRGYRGGQTGWYIGGSKWGGSDVTPIEDNTTKDVIIRRYRTIGNLSSGLWFDIRIRNVLVEELVSVSNLRSNLFMEISEGPFLISKSLLVNGTTKVLMSENVRIEDSIIYGHTPDKPDEPSMHLHWYDRDNDVHQGAQNPGPVRIEDSVLVGAPKQQTLLSRQNGFHRTNEPDRYQYGQTSYDGKRNLFYAPTSDVFHHLSYNWKDVWTNLNDWHKETGNREVDAKWQDPQFVDPQAFDFRLQPNSVLQSRADELPLQKIDCDTLNDLRWYATWTGWEGLEIPQCQQANNEERAAFLPLIHR